MEGTVPFVIIKGDVQTKRGGFNARERADAFDKLLVEAHDFFIRVITCFWQQNVGNQNAFWIESERRILRVAKTLQRQSRAGQQQEGQSHLRDDESRTHTLALHPITGSATTFVKRKRERGGAGN